MGKVLTKEEIQNRINQTFVQKVELIGEYKNSRTPVKLRCLECGYEWENKPHNFLYTDSRGPNHLCPNCGKTQRIKKNCAWCGKELERTPSQIAKNKTGYFYCSREHGNLHKNQLKMDAGEWDNATSSYRVRAFKSYPHKCLVCGWNEDDRILEVHHIDENRRNNSIDNLCILCPTCHRKITLGYYELTKDFKLLKK